MYLYTIASQIRFSIHATIFINVKKRKPNRINNIAKCVFCCV